MSLNVFSMKLATHSTDKHKMFSEVHSIKRFVESKYLTIKLVNLTFTVVSYLVFKSHRSA